MPLKSATVPAAVFFNVLNILLPLHGCIRVGRLSKYGVSQKTCLFHGNYPKLSGEKA